jgi:phospholipase A1/A2
MLLAPGVFAESGVLVFTGPAAPIAAGARLSLSLNVLNPSADPLSWTFSPKIPCRILSPPRPSFEGCLDLDPGTNASQVTIAPGAFARRAYGITLPAAATGPVTLEFPGLGVGRLQLDVQPAPPAGTGAATNSSLSRLLQQAEPKQEGHEFSPGRFFKEHISGYEPFYFLAGTKSPNARFQISFKYQLLNSEGSLAQKAPVLEGLHFAYTQTSLWDWNGPSAPFLDSSYKPELLFLRERVVSRLATGWFQLDLQGGFQHESNGRDGAASRSLNIAYLRPKLIFGKEDGLQLTLEPRAWVYLDDLSDNPDLARYRGYADLRSIVGWKRGLQLSALGRLGDTGDRGSLQLDLTYPMMSLLSRSFSVYLHAQYFTGDGESLLLYSERSSAFRFGFSLYR